MLQVDVEGYEPSVMASAHRLISERAFDHIMLEYSPGIGFRSPPGGSCLGFSKVKCIVDRVACLTHTGSLSVLLAPCRANTQPGTWPSLAVCSQALGTGHMTGSKLASFQ